MVTKDYERQENDRLELLRAVGQCITQWSRVEDALYMIFHHCIYCPALFPSQAAFVSVENFRSKLAMTDAVVRVSLQKNQLMSAWKKRHQELISLSHRRNFIAHGQVVMLSIGKARPRAVVMGSFNDPFTLIKYGTNARASRLTLKDVNSITAESTNLATRLTEFCKKLPQLAKH